MTKVKPLENFFCRGVKNPYFEHSVRTSNYLFAMFEVMCTSNMFKPTFKEYTKDTVVLSGFLHDIGKLAVPEVLLLKNGDLTNHEWCTVRKHSLYGGNILSNPETCRQIFSAWPAAQINYIADTATYHHERVDGKGYPFGLSTYIPPLAKLCSIADTFDAITSNRPYRKGITAKEALAIMFSVAGTQLDRNIVRTLLEKPTWLIPNRICEAYIQKGGELFGGNKKDSCIRDSEGFMQSKKRRVSYAQNANVDFDIDHFKKEYVQMPEARVDYHKAFLFAIMVRKASAFYSQDVLEALKQKIFGDEKQQAIFDKQLKSLHEAKELAQKLEKENILLREKANEFEVQKEAVKKREYALKEQVMLLTKRLENAEMCVRKMREESFQDEEAPILTADLNAALTEAGFEPLEKSREKNFQNELTAYERQYRIVIAGGNENLMKRFRTKHPNIVLLNNTRLGNCDAALRNADILFFKTDCISHSLYDKCKDIAHAKKIPCEYIPEITSIGAIEQTICKKIAEKIDVKEGSEGCA